jgi:hypothetical protein
MRAIANAILRGAHCSDFNATTATPYSSTLRSSDLWRMNLNCTEVGQPIVAAAGFQPAPVKQRAA